MSAPPRRPRGGGARAGRARAGAPEAGGLQAGAPMPGGSPTVNTIWASLLLDELWRCGARHVCVSPGSRSSPLAVAAARHEGLHVSVHIDERSSAFFALGASKATGGPAVLVCTSGTAAANFHPAVIEASYARTPLVVLTADRPPELRQAGALQTIDQIGLYGGATRFFVDLPAPEASAALLRALVSTVSHAAATAIGERGPVHLNVPFREPLAPVAGPPLPEEVAAFFAERDADAEPRLRVTRGSHPDEAAVESLAALVRGHARGLIVCGPDAGGAGLAEAAAAFGARAGYPVLADIASGVRFAGAGVLGAHDLFLRAALFERVAPEITIEMGGVPTSKPLRQFLDRASIRRVRLQEHADRIDPDHRARHRFETSPEALLRAVASRVSARNASPWAALFAAAERIALRAVADAEERGELPIEAAAIARAIDLVPEGGLVYLASSMPVRDADAFARERGDGLRVLVNRGASGIDGLVSSAAGAASAAERPALLCLGDLALIHDMNGLLAARGLKTPFVVLVLNNDGGGIFSFLPIAEHGDVFEPLFGTPHGLTFEHAAELYGLGYAEAPTLTQVERAVRRAFAAGGSHLIEVTGDREANVRAHRDLWSRVAGAVDDEVSWGS